MPDRHFQRQNKFTFGNIFLLSVVLPGVDIRSPSNPAECSPTMRERGKRSKEEEEGPLLHAPLPPNGVLRCLRRSELTVVPQKLRGRKWRGKRGCVADPSTPTALTAEAEQKQSARTTRRSGQIRQKRAGEKKHA